ncbi:hypothetical protein DFJ77DRAFT_210164 [Powellomyces hirtus]|nr:hypothetical protein DFJ77DRAFT_210164 [Powellomyces hirtus]
MKEVLNLALVFQLFAFTVGQKFKPVIMNFTAVIEPSEMDAIASVSCEGPANTTWQAQRAVLETSLQLAANDNTTWALETAYNCATNTKILDTQRMLGTFYRITNDVSPLTCPSCFELKDLNTC